MDIVHEVLAFAAKGFVVFATVALIVLFCGAVLRRKRPARPWLRVKRLNRELEDLGDALRSNMLEKRELRRLRKARKAWQQQPLDQTLARADYDLHRLPGASAAEFFQCPERVTDDFIKPLAGVGQFDRAATALEQLDPEVTLQFLELATELALPVRVVSGRRSNSAGGHDLSKRFQTFQRETGLREEILEHDAAVMVVVFSTINKPALRA